MPMFLVIFMMQILKTGLSDDNLGMLSDESLFPI
jgi:hypothetical protein